MDTGYQFIYDYKHDDHLRTSFNQLAEKTFGLNFEKWYQDGYWNDRYICFSYIMNNEVVSNISIHKMDLIVDEQPVKAIQIGTVMTDEKHRNKGLARTLMEYIINNYQDEYDLFYLSANETVLDFYPRFGFKLVEETKFTLPVSKTSLLTGRVRMLDVTNKDDLALLKELTEKKHPVSNSLDTVNDEHLTRFYCTNVFNDSLYYIEGERVIVAFNIEDDTLHLLGVMSDKRIDLNHLLRYLVRDEIKKVEFHFTPHLDCNKRKTSENDRFILSSNIKLPNDFVFPTLSGG